MTTSNLRVGVDISPDAIIGEGIRLAHPTGIVIGSDVRIAKNVRILQGVTLGGNYGRFRDGNNHWTMPRVGESVVIGPGAKVLGPIRIGDNSVIGANSVVTQDVPADTVVAGIPAKEISGHAS